MLENWPIPIAYTEQKIISKPYFTGSVKSQIPIITRAKPCKTILHSYKTRLKENPTSQCRRAGQDESLYWPNPNQYTVLYFVIPGLLPGWCLSDAVLSQQGWILCGYVRLLVTCKSFLSCRKLYVSFHSCCSRCWCTTFCVYIRPCCLSLPIIEMWAAVRRLDWS